MRDLDGDGIITYRDLLLLLQHIFFVPGNFIINWCHEKLPDVAQFLDLVPGGTVAVLISLMVWGFPLLLIVISVFAILGASETTETRLAQWPSSEKDKREKTVQTEVTWSLTIPDPLVYILIGVMLCLFLFLYLADTTR